MKNINKLFKIPNNLDQFTHPEFNQKFKYATLKETIYIAIEILSKIMDSGYKTVIYSESGTAPLIYICKKLCKKRNVSIEFIPFKTPRDININLYEMIMFYLTNLEKNELVDGVKRKDILYELCQINLDSYFEKDFSIDDAINNNIYDESLNEIKNILKDTYIAKLFKKKFLFFDEYINAGTILRNFKFYANLFGASSNYKIGSYCMFINNPKDFEIIDFTLYNKNTELDCYKRGAYPFENRIDIIGYYYFIDEVNYKKVYLHDLLAEFKNKNNNKLENYISLIINKLNELKILEKLKKACQEEQVKRYPDNYDIVRYLFKKIEEDLGKTKYFEYLDQVYELYAPAWSPMPVIYHLDYWQAFSKIENEINELKPIFKIGYIENRNSIFIESLNIFNKIKKEYIEKIDRVLEEL